jgi:hypothetical protein
MKLWRVLHTELLKMKRTIALKMVVLAPAAVVVLVSLMAVNAPFSTINRGGHGKEWMSLARLCFLLWAALMMPMYVALESALVAGLDHAENQWKSLLARPVPRWTWYVAKLIVVVAMLTISNVVLVGCIAAAGLVLPGIQSALAFGSPIPWTRMAQNAAQIGGLAFLAVVIQHWVSLRWRSFSVAIGTGMVAMVVGYVSAIATSQRADWPQYFPWALPMLVMSRHAEDVQMAILISVSIGMLAAAAGCWDFCRREVS